MALNGGTKSPVTRHATQKFDGLGTDHDYIQEIKNGMSSIMVSINGLHILILIFWPQVAVRLRPMWKKEIDKGEISIVKILDKNVVILMDPADVMN